jgi:F420H(2)-dependent quinone reductase
MSRQPPDIETMKAFNAEVAEEFRANNGTVGGAFEGNELLLLTTTGAKSGQPRLSPLSCKRIDGKLLIIAGYGGAESTRRGSTTCAPIRARTSNWLASPST